MELAYLKEFIVLSEVNNYLKAAEILFISQPTLTRHIQSMEKELGAALFIRGPRKIELSEFGEKFLPYAKAIVKVQEQYTAELLVEIRRDKKIIIGFGGAMSPYNVASIFSEFKKEHPDIMLEVVRPVGWFDMLRSNQCDFLMSAEYIIPKGEFNSVTFQDDKLVAVVSSSHRLAGAERIGLKDLEGEKLLVMKTMAAETGNFMSACRAAKFCPDMELTDGIDMIDFAALGQYVPIMAKQPARHFADSMVSILDIEPQINQRLMMTYRKHPALTKPEKLFLDYIKSIQGEAKSTHYAYLM